MNVAMPPGRAATNPARAAKEPAPNPVNFARSFPAPESCVFRRGGTALRLAGKVSAMTILQASHLTFKARAVIWAATGFIFLVYAICLGASAPAFGSRISFMDVWLHLNWGAVGAMPWHLPLFCLAGVILYSHLSSSAVRIGLAMVCFAGPLIGFWSSDQQILDRFGIWLGSMVAAPVLTLGVLAGWWDGEFYTEQTLRWSVAGWWMLLWACLLAYEYRQRRISVANKLTGANAGGVPQLPMRTRWAARIAQFWR